MLKSGEDYLEAILILKNKNNYVRAVDVAKHLNFSKASVSRAVSNLRSEGYIICGDDGELIFTSEGERLAKNISKKRIVMEDFLLLQGVSQQNAEQDAAEIKHCLSDESFDVFKKLLKAGKNAKPEKNFADNKEKNKKKKKKK